MTEIEEEGDEGDESIRDDSSEVSVAGGVDENPDSDTGLPNGKEHEIIKDAAGLYLSAKWLYLGSCLVLTEVQSIPSMKNTKSYPRPAMKNSSKPILRWRCLVCFMEGLNI